MAVETARSRFEIVIEDEILVAESSHDGLVHRQIRLQTRGSVLTASHDRERRAEPATATPPPCRAPCRSGSLLGARRTSSRARPRASGSRRSARPAHRSARASQSVRTPPHAPFVARFRGLEGVSAARTPPPGGTREDYCPAGTARAAVRRWPRRGSAAPRSLRSAPRAPADRAEPGSAPSTSEQARETAPSASRAAT